MYLTYCTGLLIKSHLRVTKYVPKIIILVIGCFLVQFMLKITLVALCRLDYWKAMLKSGR